LLASPKSGLDKQEKNQMIGKFLLIPIVAVAATTAGAQATDGVRLVLGPQSELTFEGTSTMHAFHCKTTKMEVTVSVDPAYTEARLSKLNRPLKTVDVVIPVKSLSCGNSGLEKNMLKTLKADKYPEIRYQLTTYQIAGAPTDDAITLQAVGTLTIAGQQKTIEMLVKSNRGAEGNATATGTQAILMTDFGIKPPVFMLGTLKTGNKITVSFKLNMSPRTVATQ
jgi:polyisoprenoid-binding protein YceI